MAVFEVEFVFSCPCFVSDALSAIEKSTMNYEIGGYVSGNHVVKDFEVVYFKNESSVFIYCHDHLWRVCVSIPKIVFTIIEGFIFKCIMILITIG